MTAHLLTMMIMYSMSVISLCSVRGSLGGSSDGVRQQECHAGQNVTLRCHTNLDADVDWMYQRNQTESGSYVYSNGVIYVSFRSRFTIDRPSEGDYNLVIIGVQPSDAGLYICVEDGGLGTRHPVELIINENEATTIAIQSTTSSGSTVVVAVALTAAIIIAIMIAVLVAVLLRFRRNRRKSQLPIAATRVGEEEPFVPGSSQKPGERENAGISAFTGGQEKPLVAGSSQKPGERENVDISAEYANSMKDTQSTAHNVDLQITTSDSVIGRYGDWDEQNAESTYELSENSTVDDQENSTAHANDTDDQPECRSQRTAQRTPNVGDDLHVVSGDGGVDADATDAEIIEEKEVSSPMSNEGNDNKDTSGLIKNRQELFGGAASNTMLRNAVFGRSKHGESATGQIM